jgi:hypothetical protein
MPQNSRRLAGLGVSRPLPLYCYSGQGYEFTVPYLFLRRVAATTAMSASIAGRQQPLGLNTTSPTNEVVAIVLVCDTEVLTQCDQDPREMIHPPRVRIRAIALSNSLPGSDQTGSDS